MVNLLFITSGIILTASFLFRDILLLRVITMSGMVINAAGGIMAEYQYHIDGMKPLIFFSALTFVINGYQVAKIIANKRPIFLPEDIKDVYLKNFTMLTTNEFQRIYKFSSLKTFIKSEALTKQGQPVGSIMLIKSGRVNIVKNGQPFATLDPYFFIGEMSFLSGEMATATVEVESDEVQIINWDKSKLMQLKSDDFDLYHKLETVLALNLIKKINK